MIVQFGRQLKINQVNNSKFDTQKIKELLSKGLELTFAKLLKQKQARNGIFILSENGQIKKIKATDLNF